MRSGSDRDNAPEQRDKPYVVVVGLDDFRCDHATKYQATRHRLWADRSPRSYPCVSIENVSNFYRMANGLYPEHHGIVATDFHDPDRRRSFHYSNVKDSSDGSRYGGLPIWALAQRQECGRQVSFG